MLSGIKSFIKGIFIWLVAGIYKLAAGLFKVFVLLTDGNIISGSDYEMFISNFYVVIGVVMLFVIAFELLKFMVNPDDNKSTSAIKKMITNLITSTIILVLLPTIFAFLFDLQSSILTQQNLLGRFFGFGGTTTESNSKNEVSQGAYMISNNIFTAFFNVSEEVTSEEELKEAQHGIDSNDSTLKFDEAINKVQANGNFAVYANFSDAVVDDKIDYNFFVSLIAGLGLLYIAVSYCLDMGVRAVKLVFYQLIAPIPIMFRIIPEGKLSGSFNQWLKITITCYLEVFTRLFALYFCIYLCQRIDASGGFLDSVRGYGIFTWLLTKACLFIGIVTFMKQAPKLLSEVTGIDSGNMKLGIKDKLREGGAFTAGSIIGGGVTNGVRRAVNRWKDKNNWQNTEGKVTAGSILKNTLGGLRGAAAGAVSGGFYSGRAGWKAGSFRDSKEAIKRGVTEAETVKTKKEAYKSNHKDEKGGVFGARLRDAKRHLGEWAGIGVVSSEEADYYTTASNAFDVAHSNLESVYKGKPGHNKIKERVAECSSLYNRLLGENGFTVEDMETFIAVNEGKREWNTLSDAEQEVYGKIYDSSVKYDLESARASLNAANFEKKFHEAEEMGKKTDTVMLAINDMVNAKIKYFDISQEIFTEQMYGLLKDTSGKGLEDSDSVKNFVDKIKNNDTIDATDFAGTIDLNSLEKFLDEVGKSAKHMAAGKRVVVGHDNALKDEKKKPESK